MNAGMGSPTKNPKVRLLVPGASCWFREWCCDACVCSLGVGYGSLCISQSHSRVSFALAKFAVPGLFCSCFLRPGSDVSILKWGGGVLLRLCVRLRVRCGVMLFDASLWACVCMRACSAFALLPGCSAPPCLTGK